MAPYAGFWRRFAAYVLDYMILIFVLIVITVLLLAAGLDPTLRQLVTFLLYGFVPWLYAALQWSSAQQATPGKMALGIKVTDEAGGRISFGRATGRYFAQILTALTFGVGYAMAVFTERRQTLHDKVAGTLVVRESSEPAAIAATPPAPRLPAAAVVGVIVVVVLFNPATLGMLAAIAIPAYQDYAIRGQVMEGLNLAAPIEAAASHAVAQGQSWRNLSTASLGFATPSGRYVERVEVSDGAVVIGYGKAAHKAIGGKQLVLTPYRRTGDPAGEVVWACGLSAPPAGTERAIEDTGVGTTIPERFLPRMCRP